MADFVLITGDKVNFTPAFGPATVAVRPGDLVGSGPSAVQGKKVCVLGDETKVRVLGCAYSTPVFSVVGVGTLSIAALAPDQQATSTRSGGKAVLLKGSAFTAQFQVDVKAQMPPPASTPDPTPLYMGSGSFITTNGVRRAT